jgi:hypothetical protein
MSGDASRKGGQDWFPSQLFLLSHLHRTLRFTHLKIVP